MNAEVDKKVVARVMQTEFADGTYYIPQRLVQKKSWFSNTVKEEWEDFS